MICRRYPGTRPSDLYGRKSPSNPDGLDNFRAFQFDAALAYRYDAIEREDRQHDLNFIMNGIRAIMRAMGVSQAKHQPYQRKIGKTSDRERQQDVERFFGIGPDNGGAGEGRS